MTLLSYDCHAQAERKQYVEEDGFVFSSRCIAQERSYRHELSAHYAPVMIRTFTGIGSEPTITEATGVQYLFSIAPKLGIGVDASFFNFSKSWDDLDSSGHQVTFKIYRQECAFFTVALKYRWIDKRHFSLYSTLNAGYAYSHLKKYEYFNDNYDKISPFARHIGLVGSEFGSTRFRGLIELGLGYKGLLQLGLLYRI